MLQNFSAMILAAMIGASFANHLGLEGGHNSPKTYQWDTSKPLRVEITRAPKDEAENERIEREKQNTVYNGRMAIATEKTYWPTAISAIFSVLAFGIAAFTFWTSIRQNRASHEATQKELRAYLHISDEKIPGVKELNDVLGGATHIKLTETLVYQLTLKNFGRTPAHDVLVAVETVVDVYPLPSEQRAEWNKLDFRADMVKIFGNAMLNGSIGPDGSAGIPVPLSHELTDEDIFLLNKGEDTAIYIYGHIEYRDAFSAEQRITNFCMLHRKKKGEKALGHSDLESWLEGNNAT